MIRLIRRVVAGGTTDGVDGMNSAELYDQGLGIDPTWQTFTHDRLALDLAER
jgi:hypothetical protein